MLGTDAAVLLMMLVRLLQSSWNKRIECRRKQSATAVMILSAILPLLTGIIRREHGVRRRTTQQYDCDRRKRKEGK